MSRRYRVRWPLLALLIGVLVVVLLAASVAFGVNILPFAVAWVLIAVIGAGSAGLRPGGPGQAWPEPDLDEEFKRPRDEGNLL